MKNIVKTEWAPNAVGTYSQGVEVNGIFYFSGQIGLVPSTMEMPHGFEAQIDQVMKNIDGLLKSQNLERSQIIKTTVFVTDLNNFSMVNKAYENYFKPPYPARSTVEVSALPKGALVEIEVIAAR